MKYKTLYYDVTPIACRLPDDCLQIIIKYAHDESKYNVIKSIPRTVEIFGDDGLWLQSIVTLYHNVHALYRIQHIKVIFGYYYGVEWFKRKPSRSSYYRYYYRYDQFELRGKVFYKAVA